MVAERKNKRAPNIPVHIRCKARNLYVAQGFTAAQTGAACGLTRDQVKQLAHRYRWLKTAHANALSATVDSQLDALASEADKVIADECQSLTFAAVDRLGQTLASDHKDMPKDAQALSATVRNLCTARSQLRGKTDLVNSQGSTQVNLFFFRPTGGSVPRGTEEQTINVTPVIPSSQSLSQ